MKFFRSVVTAAGFVCLMALVSGCVSGIRFSTESAGTGTIEGTFDLYLYGCRYPSDFENVAILVAADSPYPLDIYALSTRYKIKKGLTGEKALEEANAFIRCSMRGVAHSAVRRILDDKGKTFGYDVRPFYMPYEVPGSDVMLMNYFLRGGKVTAYITVFPEFRDLGGDDGRQGGSQGH